MVLKKATFAIKAYRLYARAWDWWQTVRKAWKERDIMDTKPSFLSKINWIAFGNILVNAFDMFGKTLTVEDQAQIVSLFSGDMTTNWLSIGVSVAIIIVRSFFTTKLTTASAKKIGVLAVVFCLLATPAFAGKITSYNPSSQQPVRILKEGPHGTFTGPVISVRSEYNLRFEDGCVKFTQTTWTLRYTITYEWGVKTNSEEVWSEGATVTVVEFCP